jgi:hypothetical protein
VSAVLAVGDTRRPALGRAIRMVLAAAALFVLFAFVIKEYPPFSLHAPWQDDPFDTVVSFTIFLVPLAAGLVVLRALLCRRDEPLPIARIRALVRTSWVVLGLVMATVAADWTSLALRTREGSWTTITPLLVAALAVTTAMTVWATWQLRRASHDVPSGSVDQGGPDALADASLLAWRWSRWLGPLRPLARAMLTIVDDGITPLVRRHPIAAAGLLSTIFGVAVASSMAVEEGVGPQLGLFLGVAACGMYAFVVPAGAYLGVVRAEPPIRGTRRRLVDASVAAALSVPVALAFRDSLWWLLGTRDASAGFGELEVLVTVAATVVFVVALGSEVVGRVHSETRG